MSPHGNTIDSRVLLSLTPLPALFDNLVSVGLKFPLTRALHLREYSNGYYSLLPYYFATVSSSLILSSAYQLTQASASPCGLLVSY